MSYLEISLIQPVQDHYLPELCDALERAFHFPTRVSRSDLKVAEHFNPAISQYNCSSLLLALITKPPPGAVKILGVTEVDLGEPIFDFIFGEAQLDGFGAILSTYRLLNELYGLPPDRNLLVQRLIKEALHEVGHTFGLIHCFQPHCVMNPSTFVEQIDTKSEHFCRQCRTSLDEKLETLL